MWTPYEIEIILHHSSSMAAFDRASAPLYEPTIQRLAEQGFFTYDLSPEADGPDRSKLRPTEKCRIFVEMLLQTPAPINAWIDPRTSKEITPERHGVDLGGGVWLTPAPGWTIE